MRRVIERDASTWNRLHIYRQPCCTGSMVRTQIRAAQQGSIPIPGSQQSAPQRESLSLSAAGLTCLLHLRNHVWQEIKLKLLLKRRESRPDFSRSLNTHCEIGSSRVCAVITTDLAPWINNMRRYMSPRLAIPPRLFLPPLDHQTGQARQAIAGVLKRIRQMLTQHHRAWDSPPGH